MCFSSCNVIMHIMCIHENVFRDVAFGGLLRQTSPCHVREIPDFLFFVVGVQSLILSFKSMTFCTA